MPALPNAVLRLERAEAVEMIERLERGEILDMNEVQLLERFFLENDEEQGLAARHKAAQSA
ncbi:MAG TPA: hypothetical protein VJL39_00345 [Candidatus Paceibacterota bacterium]